MWCLRETPNGTTGRWLWDFCREVLQPMTNCSIKLLQTLITFYTRFCRHHLMHPNTTVSDNAHIHCSCLHIPLTSLTVILLHAWCTKTVISVTTSGGDSCILPAELSYTDLKVGRSVCVIWISELDKVGSWIDTARASSVSLWPPCHLRSPIISSYSTISTSVLSIVLSVLGSF